MYWCGYPLFYIPTHLIWRLRVVGRENVPQRGGVLIAANHVSLLDPPLIGSCLTRMVHFMAKQELFEIPIFGRLISHLNAFPIKRAERDMAAFKTAQRILENGGALIIFPEGTRQRGGRLGRPKAGVGMLAHMTNTPVVPVYVHNSGALKSFKKLTVCFGPPIPPSAEPDHAAFAEKVMAAIAQLKETHIGPGN